MGPLRFVYCIRVVLYWYPPVQPRGFGVCRVQAPKQYTTACAADNTSPPSLVMLPTSVGTNLQVT